MKSFSIAAFFIVLSVSSFAQRQKKMELVNFVNEAKKYALKVGFEKACKEFTEGKKFKRGEFYIFAYDYNGVCLCHGSKKTLITKNLYNFKDKKDTPLIQELIKQAKSGHGFVKYYWDHPQEKILKKKLGYAQKIDDNWWIGSGVYYNEK